MNWQPIDSAPKDGSMVLCCWAGDPDSVCLLRWKTNDRIANARKQFPPYEDQDWINAHVDSYFGDQIEYDDYDLAEPANAPTHWLRLPDVPAKEHT